MSEQAPPPAGSAVDRLDGAKEQEHEIAREAEQGGARAFEFDPDSTIAEKKEQIKKAAPPGLDLSKAKHNSKQAAAVTTDLDDGAPPDENGALLPPPDTNGVNGAAANGEMIKPGTESTKAEEHLKAGDGNWEGTGWSPRFGSLNDALGITSGEAIADHQTLVERHLDEKFYGDWYHNAGVIGFACIGTWFVTKLGGGLAWVLIVMACCATYYRTSMKRVRRNVRDDLNREFAKTRLEADVESLEWMNSFLVKFWPIYQPVMAATIINTVDQILAGATPGFIDSLKMTTFTLGTKPPRVEHVKTYPKTEDDIVEMDWKFSFTPNDTADLTSRQLKSKINPKVVLEVRIGKGIASKGLPIVVEDMAFEGLMKIKMKLQIPFPHLEKVDVCFLQPPTFDYALKPVGGETFGIDMGFVPGLSGFIQDQIHANLGPMFYAPNVFTVEVAKMLGGAPIDTAIGVLAVTIHRATGLKNPDKFSGTPDPYAILSINNRQELARTKTVPENASPRWNETKYIIISNLNDSLTIPVYDYNEVRKDKELGIATFALDKLQDMAEHENIDIPVLANGKPRGTILIDVRFFPVLEGRKLEDGNVEPPPESNTGIVRFTVSQAKDLDHTKSMVGQLSPYVIQMLNGRQINKTKPIKRNNNPIWEVSHEMLVTNRKACKLGVVIKDDRDFQDDPVLGNYQIKLNDLLESVEKGQEWFNLANARSGRVKMTAQWKPVAIKGIVGGTGGYITPIGVMRIHFQSAKELRNLEAVGKSDPYARVMMSGVQKARTVTFENNLNPEWDEVLYIPVHSAKESLTLEVMDQENLGKDRPLGHCELPLAEFIRKNEEGLYEEHSERRPRSEKLTQQKGTFKGMINFTASFYPCLNVADPEEEEEERKLKEMEHEEKRTAREVAKQEEKKENGSLDADKLAPAAATTPISPAFSVSSEDDSGSKTPKKIRLSPDELLKYESGLMIFKIIEGQFSHKDCYLEVIVDDMAYPAYESPRIRTKSMKLEDIGDAMIRELDFSKVTIRLREHGENSEDKPLGKLVGSTRETLKQCLNNPTVLQIRSTKEGGETTKIKVSLKYIPILMKLDPSESINNMGTLRVDVIDAANLPAADRNGKSDPYCVFEVDGKQVHKTQVQKKTIHPAWNEVFECKIASRTATKFNCEVFDWDMGSKADFLGKTVIDLTTLEPFTPQTFIYNLVGKHGEEGKYGELRLRMLFKADYVTRSRQGSSTFHGTFATPGKLVTGVAGAPLKVGGFAVGGLTKGASFMKKNTFGRIGTSKEQDLPVEEGVIDPEMDQYSKPAQGGDGIREDSVTEMDGRNGRPTTPRPPNPTIEEPGTPSSTMNSTASRRRQSGLSATNIFGGVSTPHSRSRSTSSQHSVAGAGAPVSGADYGVATVKIVSATGYEPGVNLQLRFREMTGKKDIHKSKSVKVNADEVHWDESFTHSCSADMPFKIYAKDNHLFGKDEELGEGMFVVDDTGSGQDTVVPVGSGKITLRTSFKSNDQGSHSSSSPKSIKRGLGRR